MMMMMMMKMIMMIMIMQLFNQNMFQGEHDYGDQGVVVQGTTSALNPFNASSLPHDLLEPLTSQLMKSKNGEGLLPSPKEHLAKDPCGKWKMEKDLQRAALKEKVYLQNKVEKVKPKKSKCGWWGRKGRRVAKKRLEQEVAQESQLPKKKTKQRSNYGRRSKGERGRANPFPTLDLAAQVNNLLLIDY